MPCLEHMRDAQKWAADISKQLLREIDGHDALTWMQLGKLAKDADKLKACVEQARFALYQDPGILDRETKEAR